MKKVMAILFALVLLAGSFPTVMAEETTEEKNELELFLNLYLTVYGDEQEIHIMDDPEMDAIIREFDTLSPEEQRNYMDFLKLYGEMFQERKTSNQLGPYAPADILDLIKTIYNFKTIGSATDEESEEIGSEAKELQNYLTVLQETLDEEQDILENIMQDLQSSADSVIHLVEQNNENMTKLINDLCENLDPVDSNSPGGDAAYLNPEDFNMEAIARQLIEQYGPEAAAWVDSLGDQEILQLALSLQIDIDAYSAENILEEYLELREFNADSLDNPAFVTYIRDFDTLEKEDQKEVLKVLKPFLGIPKAPDDPDFTEADLARILTTIQDTTNLAQTWTNWLIIEMINNQVDSSILDEGISPKVVGVLLRPEKFAEYRKKAATLSPKERTELANFYYSYMLADLEAKGLYSGENDLEAITRWAREQIGQENAAALEGLGKDEILDQAWTLAFSDHGEVPGRMAGSLFSQDGSGLTFTVAVVAVLGIGLVILAVRKKRSAARTGKPHPEQEDNVRQ